ncbi:thiol:disulfide interchange protein [Rhodobacterales bacterium 52_120_T64]|nr:thiol:disulfide interchange protein [Rhodobacterales bacterium 52_120_T64]
MRRFLLFIPFLIAVAIGGFSLWGLRADRDPSEIPSVLISKPAPQFDLSPLEGVPVPGLSTANLSGGDGPVLVNVFASWCVPCKAEHAVLTRFVNTNGVTLFGINYKDKPKEASAWLDNLGNPYERIGSDLDGRAGIEWGISGVPETFVINSEGIVIYRHVGPVLGTKAQKQVLEALVQAGLPQESI